MATQKNEVETISIVMTQIVPANEFLGKKESEKVIAGVEFRNDGLSLAGHRRNERDNFLVKLVDCEFNLAQNDMKNHPDKTAMSRT